MRFPALLPLVLAALAAAIQAEAQRPKLVLQITVDQLRGDLLHRYGSHFGEDGFRRLLENGAVFESALHPHANTETIVGHTTLATGAVSAVHGMVANLWSDRAAGTQFYNIQDPDYPLAGAAGIDANAEIDPTQRAATTDGRSPRAILSSTISDEIALHFGPEAKVFGVSVKDRGAVAMAGHAGEAYWFSKAEARFVTSTFYRQDYPGWVEDWNSKGLVKSYGGKAWELGGTPAEYQFAGRDDQPWETDFPGFGRLFPHHWGAADDKSISTRLTLSPAGDALTADFAKTLIVAEGLGQDDVPDYLAVSFSSTDYVGHIFGPSSLEAEDNLRRLDRTLAGLLDHVDQHIGLENVLVVLSADHGAPEHPGYLAELGIEASTFAFEAQRTTPGMDRLKEEFGASWGLIRNFPNPYLYLNHALIADMDLGTRAVEDALAEELEKLPGIALAVSSTALREGAVAPGPVMDRVRANFHKDRSGDIYIVFEPHWFVADFDGLTVASAHGSPWSYDTHVPLIFMGPGIRAQRVMRQVATTEAAPTIAAFLGTKPPSGAMTGPLEEVFD